MPDVRLGDLAVFDSSPESGGADAGEPGTPNGKSHLREWVESLAFTVVFVLIFTSYVAQATRVPTESMKPTIMVGDHFFLDKLGFQANYPAAIRQYLPDRSLDRGDIVAFVSPNLGNIPFVKRLVGLPGDIIEISDKQLFVNDEASVDQYAHFVDLNVNAVGPRDNFGPVVVPEGKFFVLGDNRDRSYDSRFWGFANVADVKGKATFIYWSWDKEKHWPRFARLGHFLR